MEYLHTQLKYINSISSLLSQFKRKGESLFNFRCPYCGDSQTNKYKARGYLYKNKDGLFSFQCHNCGENHHFKNFLKHVSPHNHQEYILECFRGEGKRDILEPLQKPLEAHTSVSSWKEGLTHIHELSRLHGAKKYLAERLIPERKWGRFFYTPNFGGWVASLGVGYEGIPNDGRLVLPECDAFGNLKLAIGRALSKEKNSLRYVTIKTDESHEKVYGVGSVKNGYPVVVVEGAIDSLFLPNAVATLDANLTKFDGTSRGLDVIYCWDNEPRSVNTVRFMKRAIEKGERVVVFPEWVKGKDLNDMAKEGLNVVELVAGNNYRGAEALLKFNRWRRV